MASLVNKTFGLYQEFMDNSDPRVEDYLLMSSPVPTLLITLTYVIIVEWVGPKLMQNRQPYNLRNAMVLYNFAMVALSGYMFVEFALAGWLTGYSYGCQTVDYSRSPKVMRMVTASWLYYISKFIEFLDTLFFILRKKFSQVTFLHVFHHTAMPVSLWWGIKMVPGGAGSFHCWINNIVHFVMYTYYGLAAMGPHMQKYLWWKKYMTKLQISQFIIVIIHSVNIMLSDCEYPKIFIGIICMYNFIFLFMFIHFYINAYRKGQQRKGTISVQNGHAIHMNGSIANGIKRD